MKRAAVLQNNHDRTVLKVILLREGQSEGFDEDEAYAERKWLHPYLGSEWHLFDFADVVHASPSSGLILIPPYVDATPSEEIGQTPPLSGKSK